jgi:hypothetical protein
MTPRRSLSLRPLSEAANCCLVHCVRRAPPGMTSSGSFVRRTRRVVEPRTLKPPPLPARSSKPPPCRYLCLWAPLALPRSSAWTAPCPMPSPTSSSRRSTRCGRYCVSSSPLVRGVAVHRLLPEGPHAVARRRPPSATLSNRWIGTSCRISSRRPRVKAAIAITTSRTATS